VTTQTLRPSQTPFDCSELNPRELNPNRANYGKVNLCELLLTDFKFNPYEKANAKHTTQDPKTPTTEEIKFKNAKTSSRSLDPFTGKFVSNDTVTLYRGEDNGDNENKSEANSKEGKKSSSDKTKPKNPYFTSIRRDEEDMEYKLKEGMVEMSCFKQSGDSDLKASNLVSNQASPHRLTYLNFTLLNFAKENNFTLRDDKASAMFDMKLLLAYGNEATPTSYSSSNFTLTVQDLIIENENGEATDTDKVYLHHCSNKTVYESSSLVKNQDSVFKNSYTATFNIPIDKENKKDTKLIIYSSDLSKTHTTKDIHKRSGTAVISLSYKDKNNQSFCYLRKTSLRDITNNIINVISDNEYPFKTNEDITLKAIYKQEEKDERGNENKKYKEVVWGYKVIKTVEYNEASKSNPKDVILLKNKKDERIKETKDNKSNKEDGLIKGKEITIQISKVVTKDDLAKLKQGGHSIIFFAALKEKEKKEKETDKKKKQNDKLKDTNEAKFQFNTGYGKTHMRVDIKIPLYIKFKDDRVIIYEFEHAIKQKVFKAGINYDDALINKSGYLYINKDITSKDINIYKDDKLSKELKTDEKTNKNYRIYVDEANSANNQNPSNTNPVQSQTGQTNINQDTKYGINLLSKDNMDKFISSFNESKSLTRVDKGMWEDGDKGVGIHFSCGPFTLGMLLEIFTGVKNMKDGTKNKRDGVSKEEKINILNGIVYDLNRHYKQYKLDSFERVNFFFAQVLAETGADLYLKEFLANENVDYSGGAEFRGRGIIHLTHKENYEAFTNYAKNFGVSKDFKQEPELLNTNGEYAMMAGGFFWTWKSKKYTLKTNSRYYHLLNTKFRDKYLWEIEGVDATTNEKVEAMTRLVNGWGANIDTINKRIQNYETIKSNGVFNEAF